MGLRVAQGSRGIVVDQYRCTSDTIPSHGERILSECLILVSPYEVGFVQLG